MKFPPDFCLLVLGTEPRAVLTLEKNSSTEPSQYVVHLGLKIPILLLPSPLILELQVWVTMPSV